MVQAAGQPLKAMILLGVNGGFGNADVGTLPASALDLTGGWVNYHRPKTGVSRRCPLWPETVAALKEWLAVRPDPAGPADAGLVFITRTGRRWNKDVADNLVGKGAWKLWDNPVSKETWKLLDGLGINGHRNFYALRHTFRTIGDESGDFLAVRSIMGHAGGNDVADHYRERVSDDRLRKVADHVRGWLFGTKGDRRRNRP